MNIRLYCKKIFKNPLIRKALGLFLVIFGFIGIVTPFTPWGILFFVGLELLGVHFLWLEKIKDKVRAFINMYRRKR